MKISRLRFDKKTQLTEKLRKYSYKLFIATYCSISVLFGAFFSIVLNVFSEKKTFVTDFIFFGGYVLVVMAFIAWFKHYDLKKGVRVITSDLNLTLVNKFHTHPIARRYYEIVLSVCDQLKVQIPSLYLLESPAINSLSLASNEEDVTLLVTEGALTTLAYDELKSIIVRELLQIRSGHTHFNFKVISWFTGLQSIYLYGRRQYCNVLRKYPNKLDSLVLSYIDKTLPEEESSITLTIYGYLHLFVGCFLILLGMPMAYFATKLKLKLLERCDEYFDIETLTVCENRTLRTALMKAENYERHNMHENDLCPLYSDQNYFTLSHCYLYDIGFIDQSFVLSRTLYKRIKQINEAFPDSKAEKLVVAEVDQKFRGELACYEVSREKGYYKYNLDEELSQYDRAQYSLTKDILFCYLILLSGNEKDILTRQFDLLEQQVGEREFFQLQSDYQLKIAPLSDKERFDLFIKSIPDFSLMERAQLETFKDLVIALIVEDGKISLLEYCIWKILAHYVNQIVDDKETTDLFQTYSSKKSMIDLKNELSLMINIVLIESLHQHSVAQWYYELFVKQCGATLQYHVSINWYKALESILPILVKLDSEGREYLAEVFNQIYEIAEIKPSGQMLIHTICLVLNVRLPDQLRSKETQESEIIGSVTMYRSSA